MTNVFPMVLIVWRDAKGGTSDWTAISKLDANPAIISSMGFMVKDNDQYIMLVPHLDYSQENEPDGFGEIIIPRGMVMELSYLAIKTERTVKPNANTSKPK